MIEEVDDLRRWWFGIFPHSDYPNGSQRWNIQLEEFSLYTRMQSSPVLADNFTGITQVRSDLGDLKLFNEFLILPLRQRRKRNRIKIKAR